MCCGDVLAATDGAPDVVLIATGTEMAISIGARNQLAAHGVSLPCLDLVDRQDKA